MINSNEQRIAHAEIKAAIEGLVQACTNNKTAFCGFVWGIDPPILIRFGNVVETGSEFTELLIKLDDLANERADAGNAIEDPLTGVN